MRIHRRSFLAGAVGAAAFGKTGKPAKWDRTRLSAVTDEIAVTPAGALQFVKLYDLRWVEVRAVPGGGGEYVRLSEDALKAAAKEFTDNGIGISFLNTSMLKFWLPGSEFRVGRLTPEAVEKRKAADTKRFEDRMKYLDGAIRAAHILNVRDIRVFAFTRTEEPEKNFERIAEVLGEHTVRAEKEGVRLLLENETSCNAGTCAESAKLLKMVPSKALGINWDALNGEDMKEQAFPLGYKLLPKDRVWNVQAKGKSLMEEGKRLDWAAIITALQRDGYPGRIGLETHMFGRMLFTHSHYCIREMIRLVEQPA